MKRLLLAVGLVVMTAGTAMAHKSGFLGINIGFPLYFYPTPPAGRNAVPQAAANPAAVSPGGFYFAPPKVYRERDGDRRIVEEIYKDGRLVERRVKCYPGDWEGYR